MANGNFAGGDGSIENPYLIEDAHDLQAIQVDGLTRHYKLIKDISLDVSPYNSGEGWSPITIRGSFDGNGYTVKDLFINRPNTSNQALFAEVRGTLKNLSLDNADVTGDRRVACLSAGTNTNALIENCSVKNSVVKPTGVSGSFV